MSQIASFRQLDHRLITGEVAAVLGDLAQLVVQRLNTVGRVYDAPEHRREVQEGSEPLPGPLPGRHRLGVLDPQIGLREVGQGLPSGLLARGGVDGFESGGDLLAVPVGHEPHPGGAEPGGTRAGGDRCLGPGLPAFASGRPVSPSHSPARFAPVREVPPLRSARRSRLCWPARRTHAPRRRLLPRPGPRSLSHVLDPVHVDADRDMGRAGGDPVIDADLDPDRVEVDHREEDSSSGRRCHSRTASATASVIFEMVPADSSTLSVEARWC